VLYRTLGPTLPHDAASAASLSGRRRIGCASLNPAGVPSSGLRRRVRAGERLLDAILDSPSGVVFAADEYEETWRRIQTDDGRVHLGHSRAAGKLAVAGHETPPATIPRGPSCSPRGTAIVHANTIMRDPSWRKADADGALRVSPDDAARIGIADGARRPSHHEAASVVVTVAVDDAMSRASRATERLGHRPPRRATIACSPGVAPNELTASEDRDPWVGTPVAQKRGRPAGTGRRRAAAAKTLEPVEKGPAARRARSPRARRTSGTFEPADEGVKEADGPFSALYAASCGSCRPFARSRPRPRA